MCLSVSGLAAADLVNTAAVSYRDSLNNLLTGPSNTVVVTVSADATPLPLPDLSGIDHRTYTLQDEIRFSYPIADVTYEWSFARDAARNLGAFAAAAAAPSAAATTHASSLGLAGIGLDSGPYVLTVTVRSGMLSAAASARLSVIAGDLSSVRVYPNPWRADRPNRPPYITFDQLTGDATIKLFRLDGQFIRTLGPGSGALTWDLKDESGNAVASGLYLYLISNSQGRPQRGKVAVVR